MSSLLCVLVTTTDKGGHHLVFCYPENPTRGIRAGAIPSQNKTSDAGAGAGSTPTNLLVPSAENPLGFEPIFLADLLTPRSKLCERMFMLTVDDLVFVGHPTMVSAASGYLDDDDSPKVEPSISQFHVTLVFPAITDGAQIRRVYEHVIRPLTSALRYEQLRGLYMSQQVELLQSIKDKLGKKSIGDRKPPVAADQSDTNSVMEAMLAKSDLAAQLKHLYHSLVHRAVAHVTINGFLHLFLHLPSMSQPLPQIREYHALLLLEESSLVLSQLTPDTSPLLVRLISLASPFRSISEVQQDMNCSMAQVIRLSAHLIHWGRAKIIHVIAPHTLLQLKPSSSNLLSSNLQSQFATLFNNLPLVVFLAEFSSIRTVVDLQISGFSRQMIFNMIVFGLRHNLLQEVHTFVYLIPPSSLSNGMEISSTTDWLDRIAVGKGSMSTLFKRLSPLFNGKFHLDEIMWRENVLRNDLLQVIDKFRADLITVQHPIS